MNCNVPDSDVTDVLGHLWNKSQDKVKLKIPTLTLPETLTNLSVKSVKRLSGVKSVKRLSV